MKTSFEAYESKIATMQKQIEAMAEDQANTTCATSSNAFNTSMNSFLSETGYQLMRNNQQQQQFLIPHQGLMILP